MKVRAVSFSGSSAAHEASAAFRALQAPMQALADEAAQSTHVGSLQQRAPVAAAALLQAVARLEKHVRSPVQVLTCACIRKALVDLPGVDALARQQNDALLRESGGELLLFAAFADEWPDPIFGLYLLHPTSIETNHPFFAARGPAPTIVFAKLRSVSPESALAQAFAMHDNASIVFEGADPEATAFVAARARLTGITPAQVRHWDRSIFVGHESSHHFSPDNLPYPLSELFADLGAFASGAFALGDKPPGAFVRAYVSSLLDYFRFGRDVPIDPEDAAYLRSAACMLGMLQRWGLLRLTPAGALVFHDDAQAWRAAKAASIRDFDAMRLGATPPEYADPTPPAGFAALALRVRALLPLDK